MAFDATVTIYLEDKFLKSVTDRRHNFLGQVEDVLTKAGATVQFEGRESHPIVTHNYSLSHLTGPVGPNSLIFRRVYEYPFWYIDRHPERWNWRVAKAHFDPNGIDPAQAEGFVNRHRSRLHPNVKMMDEGFLLVPLQGKLLVRRTFQSASPLDMVTNVLNECGDRRVIATYHPKEDYSDAEMSALNLLKDKFPNFELRRGETNALVPKCSAVITQNSGVAVTGYLFHKPSIHFAKTDAHHISFPSSNGELGESLVRISDDRPDFDRYLFWLWQVQSINAGIPKTPAKIAAALRTCGWPV